MTIDHKIDGSLLTVAPVGRIDTITAPELDTFITEHIGGISELVVDLTGVEYISSAGLRVLLSAQKAMNKQGSMKVTNVCETIMEIFDITGFTDILTIE